MAILLIAGLLFITGPEQGLKITIRLVDHAEIPAARLERAEGIVSRIFHEAEIETAWLDCKTGGESACKAPLGPSDFWLQVLKQKSSRLHSSQLHDDANGFAVLAPEAPNGVSYAAVSYPDVEKTAAAYEADVASVLGAVMAHEMGHLILREKSHSAAGVMSARFHREQVRMAARGELLFTPEQARRLQAEVMRRRAGL